jgi:hypothetical protein
LGTIQLIGREANPVGSKREHTRVNCDYPCILNQDGINYLVLLVNLSQSGALVKKVYNKPDGLNIGATLDLKLCSNSNTCPTQHACRVIRQDLDYIGVNFLTSESQ